MSMTPVIYFLPSRVQVEVDEDDHDDGDDDHDGGDDNHDGGKHVHDGDDRHDDDGAHLAGHGASLQAIKELFGRAWKYLNC